MLLCLSLILFAVPGSMFPVQEFFLEDVLKLTGYTNKKMIDCIRKLENGENAIIRAQISYHRP